MDVFLPEGESAAKKFGCPFLETSAKSRTNVEKAFYDTVREIRRFNRELGNPAGGTKENGAPKSAIGVEDADGESKRGCCGGKCIVM